MPLFDLLLLYPDGTPRGGPDQMALDEALLEGAGQPVLRVYTWDGPAVSFGYSQPLGEVRRRFPEVPLVRRWTGGGMVEHGRDWTFSLVIPAGQPLAAVRPAESYRQIHAAVARALGGAVRLQAEEGHRAAAPGTCFVEPVRDDVLAVDGRKICGGAQRRTRRGILHQGSVQDCAWPEDFAERLAGELAGRVERLAADVALEARMRELAEGKYGTGEWMGRMG